MLLRLPRSRFYAGPLFTAVGAQTLDRALLMFAISLTGYSRIAVSSVVLILRYCRRSSGAAIHRGSWNQSLMPRPDAPEGVPRGSIAQGSLFAIFGANRPTTGVQLSAFPLQASFHSGLR